MMMWEANAKVRRQKERKSKAEAFRFSIHHCRIYLFSSFVYTYIKAARDSTLCPQAKLLLVILFSLYSSYSLFIPILSFSLSLTLTANVSVICLRGLKLSSNFAPLLPLHHLYLTLSVCFILIR